MEIKGYLQSRDKDGTHPKSAIGGAVVKEKVGDNDYIVVTEDGIKCHAIFNPFCGMWFIDDVYTVVAEGSE